MSNAVVPLFPKNGGSPGLDHRRQFSSIPIGEADAPVGMSVPDLRRLRRSVNAVMLFREANPDDAHWIVRARVNFRRRILFLGIPEKVRVIKEPGVAFDACDLPCPHRKRIVFCMGTS